MTASAMTTLVIALSAVTVVAAAQSSISSNCTEQLNVGAGEL